MDEIRNIRQRTKPVRSEIPIASRVPFPPPSQLVDFQSRFRKCQPIPTYSPGACISAALDPLPVPVAPGRAQSCPIVP